MAGNRSGSETRRALDAKVATQLAKYLVYVERTDELNRKYRKIYSDSGVILKFFARLHKYDLDAVERLVKGNLFFELKSEEVEDGFLMKRRRELAVASFTEYSKLERMFLTDKSKLMTDADLSELLHSRLLSVMETSSLKPHEKMVRSTRMAANYQRPRWSSENLYSSYLPDDYRKYRSETKALGNIEKRFNAKLSKAESFNFKNDMVANSLMSWFQALLITDSDIIKEHLFSGDFENWLRNSVKERELASICSNLARNLEDRGLGDADIKHELLKRLRNTSYDNSIYKALTKPLIKKIRSGEPEAVQQAAVKLMELGDERAVDALIEKLYESVPETRMVVMEALGAIGDPRAIPPLIKIFDYSTNESDRSSALGAIAMFDDKRCNSTIEKAAAEDKGEIGEEAKKIIDSWSKGDRDP